MRYLLLLLLSLGLSRLVQAQAQPVQARWQHFYGTPRDEDGGSAVAMPGGGYLQVGQHTLNSAASTLYFVRTNAQGDTLWTRNFLPPGTFNPRVVDMVRDEAGNLLVTGLDGRYGFVIKLSPTLSLTWKATIAPVSPGSYGMSLFGPVITKDGNCVVAYSENSLLPTVPQTFLFDHYLLKLNSSTGDPVWNKSFTPYFTGLGYNTTTGFVGLVAVPNGSILTFVQGGQILPPGYMKGTLMVDAGGAVTSFKKRIKYSLESPPIAINTGSSILVGRRQSVTRLTFTGDTIWSTLVPPRYPNRQWDASGIVEDSRGNVVVLSTSTETVLRDTQIHLTRLNASGRVLNDTMLYRAPDNYGRSLLLAPSDELVLAGITSSGQYGGHDLFLSKFSAFTVLAARTSVAGTPPALRCYPNPAGGETPVRVVLPDPAPAGTQLSVYDGLGRVCAGAVLPAGAAEVALPVSSLPLGLYLLRLRLPDGRVYTSKLLRQ